MEWETESGKQRYPQEEHRSQLFPKQEGSCSPKPRVAVKESVPQQLKAKTVLKVTSALSDQFLSVRCTTGLCLGLPEAPVPADHNLVLMEPSTCHMPLRLKMF